MEEEKVKTAEPRGGSKCAAEAEPPQGRCWPSRVLVLAALVVAATSIFATALSV